MEEFMVPCASCGRHLLVVTSICPFCSVSSVSGRLIATAGAVVTPIVLSACYGAPPCPSDSPDADSDGWRECEGTSWDPADCDDTNAAINPDAVEVCDDTIDNNCDGLIDAADTATCGPTDTDSDTDTDTDGDTN